MSTMSNMTLTNDNIWGIIKNYFNNDKKEMVKHHIESYDLFLERNIPDIINANKEIKIQKKFLGTPTEEMNYLITFKRSYCGSIIFTDKNTGKINIMTPEIAIKRNLTYAIPLLIDIGVKIEHKLDGVSTVKIHDFNKVEFGNIPLMVGSKFCLNSKITNKRPHIHDDKDVIGFFVVNGNEKVIVCQERMADNIPFTFKLKDGKYSHSCDVRSNTTMAKMANVFKIKFVSKDGTTGKQLVHCSFTNLKQNSSIPLFIFFNYMGIKADEDILNYILGDDRDEKYLQLLKPSFVEYHKILETEPEVEKYIKKFMNNKSILLEHIVNEKVMEHVCISDNQEENNIRKMFYIGYNTKKLLNVLLKRETITDRDDFKNKRIETPGILMAQLFKKLYDNIIKSIKIGISKETDTSLEDFSIDKYIKKSIIENGLKQSLGTGNWDSKISNGNKKMGVAQVLNRLNYPATLSHMKRLNAPVGKKGKLVEPRKLHNSQYGFCCPSESPEGQSTGLVKNIALGVNITTACSMEPILQILKEFKCMDIVKVNPKDVTKGITKIFLNGAYLYLTETPIEIVQKIRTLRRKGRISYYIAVHYDFEENIIKIYADEGRCIRPFFIINKNALNITEEQYEKIQTEKLSWKKMMNNGVIEFLDLNEIENAIIAQNQKELISRKHINFTHCEIHPSLFFSICASIIPLPDHNQAPRNIYECAMAKQAIGMNCYDTFNRMDTVSYVMHYPQRPIVYSKVSELLGFNDISCGENVVVAIATYGGYNLEDSVIVNKGSLERGLFHATVYKTYRTEEKKEMTAMNKEEFCIPSKDNCIGIRNGSYDNLEENGMIKVNSKVTGNDIIIGKITPIINKSFSNKKDIKYKDTSVQLKSTEEGIIDKVELSYNEEGHRTAKVRVRSIRVPIMADKMASRSAQKGTIGMIMNEEDMPFTEDGIVPDIIINPHCMPSRMTISQVIECVMGKIGSMKGKYFDGTPFEPLDHDALKDEMEDLGFNGGGFESLYNGETGEKIKSQIFIGPTFYQRLKHMVKDKMHARAHGPLQTLTKQPVDGRARGGGLRLGEMETDCILSHGMAYFLKEKTFESSDKFHVHVCDHCHHMAIVNPKANIYKCNHCPNDIDFSKINLPYATKLMWYELATMGINSKFHT